MKVFLYLLKSILAGISISLGGLIYLLLSNYIPYIGKILGSLFFSIGLFLVCSFKLNLYTGKIGLVFENKQEKNFYILLPIMYILNILSAISMGLISYLIFKNTSLFEYVSNLALNKLEYNQIDNIFKSVINGILCGISVYLAVKLFNFDFLKTKGILFLILFVFIFVYSGYEHCIANMYYFSFGKQLNNYLTYINILITTCFNSLGALIGAKLIKFISNKVKN